MVEPKIAEFLRETEEKLDKAFPNWDLQAPLPKLPVPELEPQMKRYLGVVRAITTDEEYENTRTLVENFVSGRGPALHAKLQQVAAKAENWAYDWWLREMYLVNPVPCLPCWSNPGMVWERQKFSGDAEMISYAARIVRGAVNFKEAVDANMMPIDRARHREVGQPFCMLQYKKVFTTYRRPGVEADEQMSMIGKKQEHIIVAHDGQFVKVNVYAEGHCLTEPQLCAQLTSALQLCKSMAQPYVGKLTALNRDVWATRREEMAADVLNAASFADFESCLFLVCFDHAETGASDTELLGRMIHGGAANFHNRWYDKTMQFVVAADGVVGLCYEHSPAEGIAVVTIIDHILYSMDHLFESEPQNTAVAEPPKPLHWNLTPTLDTVVNSANHHIVDIVSRLDLKVMRFVEFGKGLPKKCGVSPDSFIQLALQLAHYRFHGNLVSTYESAAIRRFHKGRVDNIRAASVPALAWCVSMDAEESNDEGGRKKRKRGKNGSVESQRRQLFHDAMNFQTEYMLKTILGEGLDNYLLGLMVLARDTKEEEELVFTDPVYIRSNHFQLSTSQVPTMSDSYMGYGPVVQDGYGCSYNLKEDFIIFCIGSMTDSVATDSIKFGNYISAALRDMAAMLETS